VAIAQDSGKAVSVNGPFKGPESDMVIFRGYLLPLMEENGWLGYADGTYQGEDAFLVVPPCPYHNLTQEQKDFHRILARERVQVENYFMRMKNFQCLSQKWRHCLVKHHLVFHVIVHIVNIDMDFHPLRR